METASFQYGTFFPPANSTHPVGAPKIKDNAPTIVVGIEPFSVVIPLGNTESLNVADADGLAYNPVAVIDNPLFASVLSFTFAVSGFAEVPLPVNSIEFEDDTLIFTKSDISILITVASFIVNDNVLVLVSYEDDCKNLSAEIPGIETDLLEPSDILIVMVSLLKVSVSIFGTNKPLLLIKPFPASTLNGIWLIEILSLGLVA